jgi:hypothetical protein
MYENEGYQTFDEKLSRREGGAPIVDLPVAERAVVLAAMRNDRSAKPSNIIELRSSKIGPWQIQGGGASQFCLVFFFDEQKEAEFGPEKFNEPFR